MIEINVWSWMNADLNGKKYWVEFPKGQFLHLYFLPSTWMTYFNLYLRSSVFMFADDTKLIHTVQSVINHNLLQTDLDNRLLITMVCQGQQKLFITYSQAKLDPEDYSVEWVGGWKLYHCWYPFLLAIHKSNRSKNHTSTLLITQLFA